MSMVIPGTLGDACPICFDKFESLKDKVTHVGGEKHDSFHKQCLATWLDQNSTCPIDRKPIDKKSLNTRMDLIKQRMIPALKHTAYAVSAAAFYVGAMNMMLESEGEWAKSAPSSERGSWMGMTALFVLSVGLSFILDYGIVDRIARENIGMGLVLGGMAGIGSLLTNPLISGMKATGVGLLCTGITTGISSLLRG